MSITNSITNNAEFQPRIITIGERWKARVLATINRRTLGQSRRQFSVDRQKRYLLPRAQLGMPDKTNALMQNNVAPGEPPPLSEEGFTALVQPKHATAITGLPLRLPATHEPLRTIASMDLPAPSRSPELLPRHVAQPDVSLDAHRTPVSRPTSALLPTVAADLAAVEQRPPVPLAGRTQTLLTRVLKMRIPAVKLYVDQAADTVARRHRADAVSIGDKIFFRAGKFDPDSPAGLGLLGHELTHVAQTRLAESHAPTVNSRVDDKQQELAALRNEEQVLHHIAADPAIAPLGMPSLAFTGADPVGQSTLALASQPTMQPRTAATDRSMPGPISAVGNSGAALLSEQQLQQIKDVVYRDLMARIRTDFERGG